MIKLIRGSKDPDAAREGLISQFELSREQAQAILDMRLQRLTALESDKVRAEHADLLERIGELRTILGDESKVLGLVEEGRRDRRLLRRRAAHGNRPFRGRRRD